MGVLTHMMALELELPESANEQYRSGIENGIRSTEGGTHACFSKLYGDVVVIEYDPFITTSQNIFNCVNTRHGRVRREVLLRQVAQYPE